MVELESQNIVKEYPPVKALNNVSFSCRDGDVVGVLGPNGAGKTTLLKLCACLLRPTSGRIFLDGKIINKLFPRKLGLLSTDSYLYNDLTALENLFFYAKISNVPKSEIAKYVSYFNLEEFKDKAVRELSFGQKKRVSLARLMLNDSKILLMDEPFLGLDFEAINEVKNLIAGLKNDGRIVLVTTHHVDAAGEIINRLVVLKHGSLIHFDAFDAGKGSLQSQYRSILEKN